MHPEIRRRLEFIDFNDTKAKLLKKAWPVIDKNIAPILDVFYQKVMGRPDLAKIIGDPSNIDSLKNAQRKHWGKLFEGTFDDSFYEDVRRIGKAHERIGLTPESYVSAYNFMLGEITSLLLKHFRKDADVSMMVVAATNALLVDVEMAITVYYEETQNTYNRKLHGMSTEFET
ncbi:protoglobin domain-containing protein, partial [Thalassospira lucentensis]